MTCVMNTTASSSFGSIQKAVDAAPPQKYSPSVPGRRVLATSMFTPQPIENPMPYYERSIVNFVDTLRTPIIFLYARQNPSAPFQQLPP